MDFKLSRSTIILFIITGLAVLLYTGFEVFWQLNPSLNISKKTVTNVPGTFDLETVEKVWSHKDLKEFSYLGSL